VTADGIQDLVVALGCLQLDPTAIVARNHLLVLFSRLGPFDRKLVDTLLWEQRRLFEFWAHQASIVATDDRALHLAAPPRSGVHDGTAVWMTQRARALDVVLARLATTGVVRASDFGEHAEKYESGWGARSEISDTLALLWLTGEIVPAGRDSRGRRWADADRWFGVAVGDLPEQPDAVRAAAIRSLRALGIATKQQVRKHFIRNRYIGLDNIWPALAADGEIVPVDLRSEAIGMCMQATSIVCGASRPASSSREPRCSRRSTISSATELAPGPSGTSTSGSRSTCRRRRDGAIS
jgi:hypothetical protein